MEDQPNVDNDHVHTEVVVFTYRFVLLVKEIFRCFPIAAINENIVVYGVCVCVQIYNKYLPTAYDSKRLKMYLPQCTERVIYYLKYVFNKIGHHSVTKRPICQFICYRKCYYVIQR